ncbi:hypothetical protein G4228_020563, partial [Cervus hanglu yarkandensis]
EEETLSWGPQNCSIRQKRNPPRPSVRPEAGGVVCVVGGGSGAALSNSSWLPAEDSLLQKDWDCSARLFPRTRDLKHLQVSWESQAHLPSPALALQVPLPPLTCPSLPVLPCASPQPTTRIVSLT